MAMTPLVALSANAPIPEEALPLPLVAVTVPPLMVMDLYAPLTPPPIPEPSLSPTAVILPPLMVMILVLPLLPSFMPPPIPA